MKGFNILLVFLVGFFFCFGQQKSGAISSLITSQGIFYGAQFEVDQLQQKHEVWQKYNAMATTDVLKLQFKTTVKEVCKVKGCWIIVDLADGEQVMVRFKDYGFFIPTNIPKKEVILHGLAFVEEMSISDQKHYATDGGKSAAALAQITGPKRTYSFEASGVLVLN